MESKAHKSIRNFIVSFKNGNYNKKDTMTQIEAGWFDWFCDDSELQNKTNIIGSLICNINESGKIDLDNWYVWFKNICPLTGSLYDEICFSNIETGDIILVIQIDCKWNKKKFAVLGRGQEKIFFPNKPLYETNSSNELVSWLNAA